MERCLCREKKSHVRWTGRKRLEPGAASCVRFLVTVLLVTFLIPASPTPGTAFELFGMRFFEGDAQDQFEANIPNPVTYVPSLSITGDTAPSDVERTLQDASALMSDADRPVSGQLGLISKARSDQERIIATLYTLGRYGGTVDIFLNNMPLDQAVANFAFGPDSLVSDVPVEIRVDPGPQFTFGNLDLRSPDITPGVPVTLETFGLRSGDQAKSGLILSAEDQIVAAYRERGHPLARVTGRDIVADHDTQTLDVTVNVEPGPVATFGDVTVSGVDKTDPAFVEMMAAVPQGERYSPKDLRKVEERLRELGVFGTISVQEGDAVDAQGQVPITINVSERKRKVIGAGVTFTSTEGLGFEGYWRHRNLFGGAERLSVEGSIGRLITNAPDDYDYNLALAFAKPGVLGSATEFRAKAEFEHLNPDSFSTLEASVEAGVEKQFNDHFDAYLGVELEVSRTRDAFGINESILIGAPLILTYDSRDDERDPSSGLYAEFETEPVFDLHDNAFFWINQGSVAGYQSLDDDDRMILAARLGAGSIWGASLSQIPTTRRFFLGGGGSIRGYAFQNVGPRNAAGQAIGGRSYVEGQLEARFRITDKIGFVPFVDAGAAFTSEIPDFSEPLSVAAGAGLRYFTPIGPLRFDVAVPFSPKNGDPHIAFYVGLAQAF